MKNTKEQISSFVFMFSIGCFIQSSAILMGFVSSITKQDSWIVTIIGFILTLPIIWLYISLSAKFPGKSLIEINDIVFGKIAGKIFSVLYIFFFFSLSFLNSNIAEGFVISSLMPETPKIIISVFFVFLCCYAVRKGVETMTRCSTLFIFIVCVVMITNAVVLINLLKLSNFQPLFDLPLIKYIQGTQIQIFLPFSEMIVFFMLFPDLKRPKDIKKPMFLGLIIGALTFFIIITRDIAILGPMIAYMSYPAYDTVRLIDFGDVLTRMEFFYVALLIMLLFFKVSILIYAVVKGLEQIFKLSSYKILVPVIGVLVIFFSLTVFDSESEATYWGSNVAAVYSTFFELVLPLTTLIVASLRGFKKPVGANI